MIRADNYPRPSSLSLITIACLTLGAFHLVAVPAHGQSTSADSSHAASLRLGVEYDDNAYSAEAAEAKPDFLTRYFTVFDALHPVDDRGQLSVNLRHGGKLFFVERDADTLLTQIDLGYRHGLTRHLALSIDLDLKDRSERRSVRDYNRGGARLGAHLTTGPVRSGLSAGWRYFAFKPNPLAGSHGPQAHGFTRWFATANLAFDASYTYAVRAYDTPRLLLQGDVVILDDQGPRREDHFQALRLGASLRWHLFVDLHYVLSTNGSNSYGHELNRHGLELNLTAPLPFDLYASLRAELQRTRYEDPVLIDEIFVIDDENRNSLTLAIARPVFEHWEIEARYSLYRQEFGVGEPFGRQTFLVAIGYTLD
jgi:hypothetical protein